MRRVHAHDWRRPDFKLIEAMPVPILRNSQMLHTARPAPVARDPTTAGGKRKCRGPAEGAQHGIGRRHVRDPATERTLRTGSTLDTVGDRSRRRSTTRAERRLGYVCASSRAPACVVSGRTNAGSQARHRAHPPRPSTAFTRLHPHPGAAAIRSRALPTHTLTCNGNSRTLCSRSCSTPRLRESDGGTAADDGVAQHGRGIPCRRGSLRCQRPAGVAGHTFGQRK